MNEKDKTTQTPVEDLTITGDEATEVKGGVWFPTYKGIDGEATMSSTPSVSEIVVTKVTDCS